MAGSEIRLLFMAAAGLFAAVFGTLAVWKKDEMRYPFLTIVLGVLLLIGSAFGIEGMREFRQFISVLQPMLDNPSDSTYAKALSWVGEGKLSDRNAEMAAAIATARPIPNIVDIVKTETAQASDSGGARILTALERNVKAQDSVASHLANELVSAGGLDETSFGNLDRAAQALVARKLLNRPSLLTPQQMQRLQGAAQIDSLRRRN